MSDEASLTSGTSPTGGSRCHWVPSIVLFEVMWTYAAPGVSSSSASVGIRLKPVAAVDPVSWTLPTRRASLAALSAQEPVMT